MYRCRHIDSHSHTHIHILCTHRYIDMQRLIQMNLQTVNMRTKHVHTGRDAVYTHGLRQRCIHRRQDFTHSDADTLQNPLTGTCTQSCVNALAYTDT